MKSTLNLAKIQYAEQQKKLSHEKQGSEENKAMVERFLTGKMKALKCLDETYSAKWPPVIRQFNGAQLLGHACSGRSFDSP